jgi:hypothetical protein
VIRDGAARRLLSQAVLRVDESRALSYALSLTLAATPRETLSGEEIDALCQLAYELQTKLDGALELLREIEMAHDPGWPPPQLLPPGAA